MAKIILTHKMTPAELHPEDRESVYNGLDAACTLEILGVLKPQLDNLTAATYAFSRELQGPVLEMNLRGILIDKQKREEVIDEYFEKIDHLERNLERIVFEGVGMVNFNWRSNDDLKTLFYDLLGIPPIKKRKSKSYTVDRNALEKIREYMVARPIVNHLLAMRDLKKKIEFLRTEVDDDGRMRTSLNISGTSTGRFSSSYSEYGTGGNLQNVEERLREVFIPDPGYKFAKFDAKSGESFVVGAVCWNLFEDGRYLDACETGDPHTITAKMVWPELPWTGNLKRDKALAEQPYYRHYTYRFMCKKLGHGSNYLGKPPTLAQQAAIEIGIAEDFQYSYFQAYPGIPRWHDYKIEEFQRTGHLVSLTGRKRYFFGRRDDEAVHRELIAYDPQGSLADIVNRALLRIWRAGKADPKGFPVICMMQDHDAITIQYPEELEDVIIPKVQALLPERIELMHGRTLTIPYDCKVGWNKAEVRRDDKGNVTGNPHGLQDYRQNDKRKRPEKVHILDRVFRRTHK